jgi:hypothetical protein
MEHGFRHMVILRRAAFQGALERARPAGRREKAVGISYLLGRIADKLTMPGNGNIPQRVLFAMSGMLV